MESRKLFKNISCLSDLKHISKWNTTNNDEVEKMSIMQDVWPLYNSGWYVIFTNVFRIVLENMKHKGRILGKYLKMELEETFGLLIFVLKVFFIVPADYKLLESQNKPGRFNFMLKLVDGSATTLAVISVLYVPLPLSRFGGTNFLMMCFLVVLLTCCVITVFLKYKYRRSFTPIIRDVLELYTDLRIVNSDKQPIKGLKRLIRIVTCLYIVFFLITVIAVLLYMQSSLTVRVSLILYNCLVFGQIAFTTLTYVSFVCLVKIGFESINETLNNIRAARRANILVIRSNTIHSHHLVDELQHQHFKLFHLYERINECFGLFLLTTINISVIFITINLFILYRMTEMNMQNILLHPVLYTTTTLFAIKIGNICGILTVNETTKGQVSNYY
jgi:hypothetical protein